MWTAAGCSPAAAAGAPDRTSYSFVDLLLNKWLLLVVLSLSQLSALVLINVYHASSPPCPMVNMFGALIMFIIPFPRSEYV